MTTAGLEQRRSRRLSDRPATICGGDGGADDWFPTRFFRRTASRRRRLLHSRPVRDAHRRPGDRRRRAVYEHLVYRDASRPHASWSPLPNAADRAGFRMNDRELAANGRQDPSRPRPDADPRLPFADSRFDARHCCVSIDYLTRRSSVPRGPARACRRWHLRVPSRTAAPDQGHQRLLASTIVTAGIVAVLPPSRADRPDGRVVHLRPPPGDPLYAVWAARQPPTLLSLLTRTARGRVRERVVSPPLVGSSRSPLRRLVRR